MPGSSVHIRRHFQPDVERCVTALNVLLRAEQNETDDRAHALESNVSIVGAVEDSEEAPHGKRSTVRSSGGTS